MDFGSLLSRTWDIVWNNKFLIVLGILISLGSGGAKPSNTSSFQGNGSNNQPAYTGNTYQNFPQSPEEWQQFWQDFDQQMQDTYAFMGFGLVFLIPILCIIFTVVIALWVVSTIARGGLIASVDVIDGGGASSFSEAFQAGWGRGWRLVGIGLLPAIPGLVLLLVSAGLVGALFGVTGVSGQNALLAAGGGIALTLLMVVCLAGLASFVLNLLRVFAERACMLEDTGVFESYQRGTSVLMENIGSALLLFLLQVAIQISIAIVLFLPGLCCLLWPAMLVVDGGIEAYFQSMWTLAWRGWTNRGAMMGEPPMDVAPAV